MGWRLIKTVIILPGTALVAVPGLLLWIFAGGKYAAAPVAPADWRFWLALVALVLGVVLASSTVRLFVTMGQGTPAPWHPPQKLVVAGPYRHVRNPMIASILFMSAAEAVFLRSWPLAGWGLFFFAANSIYFPLSEERGLERRFGEPYRIYKANVPRWFPRLRPWTPPPEQGPKTSP